MGLFDEMKHEAVMKGPPCSVKVIIEQMTDEEQTEFAMACADWTIPGTVIAKVLQRKGFNVKAESLRRHRKGECRCE